MLHATADDHWHGKKGHHTFVLNDGSPLQSCYCHVCNGASLGANVSAFYLFRPFDLFLPSCNLVGRLEGGVILGMMPTTSIPYTPLLSKFVESPKLAFLFITSDVSFVSSRKLTCQGISFKTYQA